MLQPLKYDEFSLTFFRRLLCISWVLTLITKMMDLEAHYTDQGILPRSVMQGQPWKFSLNMISGTEMLQLFILGLSLISSLYCIFGKKKTLSSVVVWLTCISILSRNELVLNGADHYFSMLLFWNILLAWRKTKSVASIGYIFQIIIIYFFTGLAKSYFDPWISGTAMRDILNLDILTRPWSQVLISNLLLMKIMTWLTLLIEFMAPICLFIGIFHLRIRIFTLFVLFIFHIGIAFLLKLYFIPVTSILSLIPIIPSQIWKHEQERISNIGSWISKFFVGSLLLLFLLWNIANLPGHPIQLINPIRFFSQAFRFDQDWSFFAPPPFSGFNGWWVIEGLTFNGSRVDVWNNSLKEPDYSKPVKLSNYYDNQHWTAYFINIGRGRNLDFSDGLLGYLCWRWNSKNTNNIIEKIKLIRIHSIFDQSPVLRVSREKACARIH